MRHPFKKESQSVQNFYIFTFWQTKRYNVGELAKMYSRSQDFIRGIIKSELRKRGEDPEEYDI